MNKEYINNSYKFIELHKLDSDEKQQAQMWIRDFLEIFNIPAEKINIGFEWRVNIDGKQKYADHLLNGVLLIEMKSKGKKLDKAKSQAFRYVMNLENDDVPKYVLLSNFERMQLHDLNNPENIFDFRVKDLHKHLSKFNFLLNKINDVHIPDNPVNEKAAKLMEELHTAIIKMNYPKNASDLLMTRIVFCLFAEDSGIFENNQFTNFIRNETKADGSDLVDKLATLFQVLNTPEENRFQTGILDEFPYINGGLFEVHQPIGLALNKGIREKLINTSNLDWSKISPVIFGSMFEGAMDKEKRHSLGAHYTSEINIMKVIDGLFLNDLKAEFENILKIKNKKYRKEKLEAFHSKLSKLKFLDPACGSGNFLMVAYRELRRLEHDVVDEINEGNALLFDTTDYIKVEIKQFYGIEIVPYAVSVAKIGLWMMDHLMNLEASSLFGRLYLRLPLHPSANIVVGNALKIDWEELISPSELNYILGNPPFIGSKLRTDEQKEDFINIMKFKNAGNLDYVAAWYYKSTLMMEHNKKIKAALVSTNSIFQGEQANILWMRLFALGIFINFAHRTFKWDNNGAVVHVAIAGFSMMNENIKYLTSYSSDSKIQETQKVKNINEYLVDAPKANIQKSKQQISNMPIMTFGSMANSGKYLFLNESEYKEFINKFPEFQQYIFLFIGSREYIRNEKRYIFYLKEAPISMLKNNKEIIERIRGVKNSRLQSKRDKTKELASTPTLLGEDRVSFSDKLLIPKTSSSKRNYIPIGFVDKNVIVSDGAFQINNASLYIFGILQSKMHVLWIKTIAGRLKSDIRYSNTLVYNTFVFPKTSKKEIELVERASNKLLDVRKKYLDNGQSIADLYDELFMPKDLQNAHRRLDDIVESLYSKQGFKNDGDRIAFLIKLYQNTNKNKKRSN